MIQRDNKIKNKELQDDLNDLPFKLKYRLTIKAAFILLIASTLSCISIFIYSCHLEQKEIERQKITINKLVGVYLGEYNSIKGTRLEIFQNDSLVDKQNQESILAIFSIIGKFKVIDKDTLILNSSNKSINSANNLFGEGVVRMKKSGKIVVASSPKNRNQWHFTKFK